MPDIQELIDKYAEGIDHSSHAAKFLELNRWTGDNPLLLLADAAGTTTGQNYFTHVKPSVEAFKEEFLDTERISSLGELATLNQADPDLLQVFDAQRKRHVLTTGAGVFAGMDEEDELARLQSWARTADPTSYRTDPFGQITGVGLRTFQYLRMIAGIDTVKPDIQVQRFIDALADTTHNQNLDSSTDQSVLESCRWLADNTDYRMIEIDQIAWWYFSDSTERHATNTLDS